MKAAEPPDKSTADLLDPVYLHARREAAVILAVFAVVMGWSIAWCYGDGYLMIREHRPEVPIVLGMPRWVFWGIFVPWLVADTLTLWFAFCFFTADDLGEAHEGADLAEQIEEGHLGLDGPAASGDKERPDA